MNNSDSFDLIYEKVFSAYIQACGGHYEPKSERNYQLALKLQPIVKWMIDQQVTENQKEYLQ